MDEATAVRLVVAHLFQRAGRHALSENEMVNAMSLDLKWYPPKAARQLVAGLAREGHVRRTEEGELEPAFEVRDVKVPLAFRPPAELASAVPEHRDESPGQPVEPAPGADSFAPTAVAGSQPDDGARSAAAVAAAAEASGGAQADAQASPFGLLLAAVADESGVVVADWVSRMDAAIQASGDALTPEAALLLVAAESGVDVRPWIGAARRALV